MQQIRVQGIFANIRVDRTFISWVSKSQVIALVEPGPCFICFTNLFQSSSTYWFVFADYSGYVLEEYIKVILSFHCQLNALAPRCFVLNFFLLCCFGLLLYYIEGVLLAESSYYLFVCLFIYLFFYIFHRFHFRPVLDTNLVYIFLLNLQKDTNFKRLSDNDWNYISMK